VAVAYGLKISWGKRIRSTSRLAASPANGEWAQLCRVGLLAENSEQTAKGHVWVGWRESWGSIQETCHGRSRGFPTRSPTQTMPSDGSDNPDFQVFGSKAASWRRSRGRAIPGPCGDIGLVQQRVCGRRGAQRMHAQPVDFGADARLQAVFAHDVAVHRRGIERPVQFFLGAVVFDRPEEGTGSLDEVEKISI